MKQVHRQLFVSLHFIWAISNIISTIFFIPWNDQFPIWILFWLINPIWRRQTFPIEYVSLYRPESKNEPNFEFNFLLFETTFSAHKITVSIIHFCDSGWARASERSAVGVIMSSFKRFAEEWSWQLPESAFCWRVSVAEGLSLCVRARERKLGEDIMCHGARQTDTYCIWNERAFLEKVENYSTVIKTEFPLPQINWKGIHVTHEFCFAYFHFANGTS